MSTLNSRTPGLLDNQDFDRGVTVLLAAVYLPLLVVLAPIWCAVWIIGRVAGMTARWTGLD
jgi:hypothetical protein